MVLFPYLKKGEPKPGLTEVEERPKDPIEEATIKCEEAFSNLEKYLHSDEFNSDILKELSINFLDASKSFSRLGHCTNQSIDYSLEMLNYSKEIENNLKKLKKKISLYKTLESGFGKFMTCAGISLITGLISYYAISNSVTPTDSMISFTTDGLLFAALGGGGAAVSTVLLEKNIITPFVQRSHYSPIENIVKYSELFFYDLREKTKNI